MSLKVKTKSKIGRHLSKLLARVRWHLFQPQRTAVLCAPASTLFEPETSWLPPWRWGGHWLVQMEWRPAGWWVCLPLLIYPCTIKCRSSLLAPAHPGGPGKMAIKRLWCGGGNTIEPCLPWTTDVPSVKYHCWTLFDPIITDSYITYTILTATVHVIPDYPAVPLIFFPPLLHNLGICLV